MPRQRLLPTAPSAGCTSAGAAQERASGSSIRGRHRVAQGSRVPIATALVTKSSTAPRETRQPLRPRTRLSAAAAAAAAATVILEAAAQAATEAAACRPFRKCHFPLLLQRRCDTQFQGARLDGRAAAAAAAAEEAAAEAAAAATRKRTLLPLLTSLAALLLTMPLPGQEAMLPSPSRRPVLQSRARRGGSQLPATACTTRAVSVGFPLHFCFRSGLGLSSPLCCSSVLRSCQQR